MSLGDKPFLWKISHLWKISDFEISAEVMAEMQNDGRRRRLTAIQQRLNDTKTKLDEAHAQKEPFEKLAEAPRADTANVFANYLPRDADGPFRVSNRFTMMTFRRGQSSGHAAEPVGPDSAGGPDCAQAVVQRAAQLQDAPAAGARCGRCGDAAVGAPEPAGAAREPEQADDAGAADGRLVAKAQYPGTHICIYDEFDVFVYSQPRKLDQDSAARRAGQGERSERQSGTHSPWPATALFVCTCFPCLFAFQNS